MGPVGVQEMVVIFLVALVLFGPKKLPELGKTIGKAISEFRRAQSELKATLEHHMSELERENESLKEVTRSFNNEIYNAYDSPTTEPYYGSGSSAVSESPSIASNPATVSASATEGAETTVSHEIATGTVPRTSPSYAEHSPASPEAAGNTTPESDPVRS